MRRSSSFGFRVAGFVAALGFVAVACAFGQGGDSGKTTVTSVPDLIETPFYLPNLGVAIRLPEDALIDLSEVMQGATRIRIWPQDESEAWKITVFGSQSTDTRASSKDVLERLISEHQKLFPAADPRDIKEPQKDVTDPSKYKFTLVRVFDRDDSLRVGTKGEPAVRAYLDVPSAEPSPACAYTVFENNPGQFVVLQLECPAAVLPKARVLYEAMVALVDFRDPTELGAERAAPLMAGDAFLSSLTNEDLDAACASEQPMYFRIFDDGGQNKKGAVTEIAWQRVEIKLGQLGELDSRRDKSSWTHADREFGYIVRVDARALIDGFLVDSEGIFFLSRDRQNERWSIRNEVKSEQVVDYQVQTVVRRGSRLTVKTQRQGDSDRNVEYVLPTRGYISKVESYLLPRLVALKNAGGAYAFYNYDPSLGKVTLRRETFEPIRRDGWKQITRHTENAVEVTTTLDPSGHLLLQEQIAGQTMEPSTPEEIQKLWSRMPVPKPKK